MGQLRRPAVILWTVLGLSCAPAATPNRKETKMVELSFDRNGRFVVKNSGASPVELRRKVLVERMEERSWVETAAEVHLIASCAEKDLDSHLHLASGGQLVMTPWNGWGCDGQCPRPCRSNYYLGPGEFRYVVHSADGKHRLDGPRFSLGPEKPR